MPGKDQFVAGFGQRRCPQAFDNLIFVGLFRAANE